MLNILVNCGKIDLMSPDEKAKDLLNKFKTKPRAILVVDEIIASYSMANVEYEDGYFENYWKEVVQEISKLNDSANQLQELISAITN